MPSSLLPSEDEPLAIRYGYNFDAQDGDETSILDEGGDANGGGGKGLGDPGSDECVGLPKYEDKAAYLLPSSLVSACTSTA